MKNEDILDAGRILLPHSAYNPFAEVFAWNEIFNINFKTKNKFVYSVATPACNPPVHPLIQEENFKPLILNFGNLLLRLTLI